jgi:putative addiction module component (TIGR02574 family)
MEWKKMSITELFDQAQILPTPQREQLALMLLETLPADDDGPVVIDEEYEAELERRLESIRSGQSKGHSLEDVMKQLRETLRQNSAS